MINNFGGSYYFAVALSFGLSYMFLLYGLTLYRFHDRGGFHGSTTVHGFLKSWWLRCFLRGD